MKSVGMLSTPAYHHNTGPPGKKLSKVGYAHGTQKLSGVTEMLKN